MLLACVFTALGTVQAPTQDVSVPTALKALPAEVKPLQSLRFTSTTHAFLWDKLIPVELEVDGLLVKTIFFNEREPKSRFLKGRKFGHRAQLEVKNTSSKPRTPGFAVAVVDEEGRLLGVASGGTKFGTVKPGESETFDLNFFQVKQRLPRGARFLLSIELRN